MALLEKIISEVNWRKKRPCSHHGSSANIISTRGTILSPESATTTAGYLSSPVTPVSAAQRDSVAQGDGEGNDHLSSRKRFVHSSPQLVSTPQPRQQQSSSSGSASSKKGSAKLATAAVLSTPSRITTAQRTTVSTNPMSSHLPLKQGTSSLTQSPLPEFTFVVIDEVVSNSLSYNSEPTE